MKTQSKAVQKLIKTLDSIIQSGFFGELKVKFRNGDPVVVTKCETVHYEPTPKKADKN